MLKRVCGCVCVSGVLPHPLRPLFGCLASQAITHIVIEHTRSNAFCLDFIFFCCMSLLLLLLLAPSALFFGGFVFLYVLFSFFLYILGSGDVDIKCKTEFHFRQECSERSCCYWECYNIVEACNILPRIRVGTLTQTRTHMYVQRTLPTASCMLLTISARVSHPSSVFFSLLANLVYWFCVPVCVWEELLRMCVREFPFLG